MSLGCTLLDLLAMAIQWKRLYVNLDRFRLSFARRRYHTGLYDRD